MGHIYYNDKRILVGETRKRTISCDETISSCHQNKRKNI